MKHTVKNLCRMEDQLSALVQANHKGLWDISHPSVKSKERIQRFLNAHDDIMEEAYEAYVSMLSWRQELGVDALRETILDIHCCSQYNLPHFQIMRDCGDYGPWFPAGASPCGEPIHLEVIGKVNVDKLLDSLSLDQLVEHTISFIETRAEHLDTLSRLHGRIVRSVQILDMSNFGLHQLKHVKSMSLIHSIIKAGTKNYPESLSKAVFVNTPTSFHTFWPAISLLLRKNTLAKVNFLGACYHRQILKQVNDCVVLHRLDKMIRLKNGDFVDRGSDDDHLPLMDHLECMVSAREKREFFLYLTRTGDRQCVQISTTETLELPPQFSWLYLKQGAVEEIKVEAIYSNGYYNFEFPKYIEDISCGFLAVEFDNTSSWLYSITVPLSLQFYPTKL